MKNSKKLYILVVMLLIAVSIFTFIQIYAKYLTSAEGNTNLTIARWNILVNNQSIKDNSDISNSIVPVFPGNDNIAKDIIAPTAEGYFDLDFDFSAADVSFKYEINTSVSEESSVKDLVATGYSVDDGPIIEFTDYTDTTISDTILLSSNIKNRHIRVYILWNDNPDSSEMTNEDDTLSTSADTPPILNVSINFTQEAS